MKGLIISLLSISAIIFLIAGCTNNSSNGPTAPEPTTHEVSMVENAFDPADLTINEGDTVHWTNNGVRVHTSTSGTNGTPDGIWDSGDIAPGGTYERTFNAAGTFPYYCVHHYTMGMTGTITVVTP